MLASKTHINSHARRNKRVRTKAAKTVEATGTTTTAVSPRASIVAKMEARGNASISMGNGNGFAVAEKVLQGNASISMGNGNGFACILE